MRTDSVDSQLSTFLEQEQADGETIITAARYYLALLTDDLPAEDMDAAIRERVADEDVVASELRELGTNVVAQEQVALTLLSYGWNERNDRESVVEAVREARGKLPVIEIALITISVTYMAYLLVTRGVNKKTRIVERRPDGTFTERETTEYFGPDKPLSALAGVLTRLERS